MSFGKGASWEPRGQTDLEFLGVPGVRPSPAAHNAVGLAGEWKPRGQTDLEFLGVPGVRPSPAAHNAVGLAGESPVVGIDCLPT